MYEVGRRAGVGQATLYRHFASREDLVMAIFAEQIDELERAAAGRPDEPSLFAELLALVVENQARCHGLVDCLGTQGGALLARRLEDVLAHPLEVAKRAALVRADARLSDVHLMIAMVDGALRHEADEADRQRAARRVLDLALGGFVPRPE